MEGAGDCEGYATAGFPCCGADSGVNRASGSIALEAVCQGEGGCGADLVLRVPRQHHQSTLDSRVLSVSAEASDQPSGGLTL